MRPPPGRVTRLAPDAGATSVEYALIATAIAVAVVLGVTLLGAHVLAYLAAAAHGLG